MSEYIPVNGVEIAIQAFQQQMMQKFNVDCCPLVTNDDWMGKVKKSRLRNTEMQGRADRTTVGDVQLYPCHFLRLNTFGIDAGGHNVQNIVRTGSGYTVTPELTTASVIKQYKLWANVDITLHAKFLDFSDYLSFGELFSILIKSKALNSKVDIGETDSWSVMIEADPIINHSDAMKEANEGPDVYTLTHPIKLKTQFGGYREVAKVNNEGRVDTSLTVGQESFP